VAFIHGEAFFFFVDTPFEPKESKEPNLFGMDGREV